LAASAASAASAALAALAASAAAIDSADGAKKTLGSTVALSADPAEVGLTGPAANTITFDAIPMPVGAVIVGLLSLATGGGEVRRITQVPPQFFLGGLLGAIFVGSSLFLVPKLGATAMVGAFITGQLMGSILIDHYGLLGLAAQPVTSSRLFGVILLFTGLLMVVKKGT
jgi:transporter family-2 protein